MSSLRSGFSLALTALLLSLSFAGCDGGEADPATEETLVASMPQDEFITFCNGRLDHLSDEQKSAKWQVWCVDDQTKLGQCSAEQVTGCVETRAQLNFINECRFDRFNDVASCGDVTVTQILACDQAIAGRDLALAPNLTCESFAAGGSQLPAFPVECAAVQEKCPAAITDSLE